MRLAVVGWAGDSGVGRELISAVRNLPVDCAFVFPNPVKPSRTDLLQGTPTFLAQTNQLELQMNLFLDAQRPDTILTWEIPGNWTFPKLWRDRGIRWVHVAHWDWFQGSGEALNIWPLAQLVSPNRMCQRYLRQKYSLESVHLPVPIDTDRLAFRERRRAVRFVSVYGYGGAHDRRSLPEILAAWKMLSRAPELTIRAQCALPKECGVLPPSVKVLVGNTPEPGELYDDFDVAVQPSRYEGVGVSMMEAQACGVPVITTQAPPMDEFARELPVSVAERVQYNIMHKMVDAYIPSVPSLAQTVMRIHNKDIGGMSRAVHARVERELSWKALGSRWLRVLSGG